MKAEEKYIQIVVDERERDVSRTEKMQVGLVILFERTELLIHCVKYPYLCVDGTFSVVAFDGNHRLEFELCTIAVSYTHLTLPTILLV